MATTELCSFVICLCSELRVSILYSPNFFYVVGAYQSDIGDMRFSGSHVQVRNLNLLSKLKGVLR